MSHVPCPAVFSDAERERLLALKGVGPAVLLRLEQTGHAPLAALVGANPVEIVAEIAYMMRTSCWKNNPHAIRAIGSVIDLANLQHEERQA
ncbi:helix-hairpin-helix domain-containing protein [Brachymonas denitrificans]|jgi:predicted aconitase with swiveling domain|uniref:helix-hairpin-helix domain-containing protein n=1 Tax=Brachymonas denitrificans TaxID=28220 RepID=UPI001BCBCEAB|nr:helix-hairpin-helix domain-containing protein [Brachymonas denitrificans]